VPVAESAGSWQPALMPLNVNDRPSWAAAPGDWVANVSRVLLTVTRDGVEVQRRDFPIDYSSRTVPLQLFEPYLLQTSDLEALATDTVTIEVALRFGAADPLVWAPLIDPYGQCAYASWPEKVSAEADLLADIVVEDARLAEMPPSSDVDQYGGYVRSDWKEAPTGYYRVAKKDGFWWLITPEGNPCFYMGLSVMPASDWPRTPVTGREALFAWLPPLEAPWGALWGHDVWGIGEDADYVALQGANLIRKYGPDTWLADARARSVRRVRAFGFGGGSKWGAPAGMPATPVLGYGATPKLVYHIDVFDPAVRATAKADLANQVSASLNDPLVIGWSVGSERDELIAVDEVPAILAMASTVPAKRALLDYAVDTLYGSSVTALASAWGLAVTTRDELYAATPTPPVADVEQMRLYYADQYYAFNYATIKEVDPNHLYLGCYVCPFCADTEEDIRRVAQHCDVVSWDIYAPSYGNARFALLSAEFDKPLFIGEFSYPPFYDGARGFGRYGVYTQDDAEAGDKYRAWVEAATADPRCVGGSWFEYRDQPLTGRGAGSGPALVYGEHYAFGVVTQTDRVKWELATRMRAANLGAPVWRFRASGRPFPDVPVGFWALDQIAACAEAGIVQGYGDGTYRPKGAVTRGQMAIYIARALAGGEAFVPTGPATASFTDVAPADSVFKYVEYAVAQGVVTGYTEPDLTKTYRPGLPLNRGQMAAFLARSMCGGEGFVPTGPATASFPDVATGFGFYDHVEYIYAAGVTTGYEDGTYRPQAGCLRDQMAVFVARAFHLLP
jgi:hypothetical protein